MLDRILIPYGGQRVLSLSPSLSFSLSFSLSPSLSRVPQGAGGGRWHVCRQGRLGLLWVLALWVASAAAGPEGVAVPAVVRSGVVRSGLG